MGVIWYATGIQPKMYRVMKLVMDRIDASGTGTVDFRPDGRTREQGRQRQTGIRYLSERSFR
jgi:hypothetical protein